MKSTFVALFFVLSAFAQDDIPEGYVFEINSIQALSRISTPIEILPNSGYVFTGKEGLTINPEINKSTRTFHSREKPRIVFTFKVDEIPAICFKISQMSSSSGCIVLVNNGVQSFDVTSAGKSLMRVNGVARKIEFVPATMNSLKENAFMLIKHWGLPKIKLIWFATLVDFNVKHPIDGTLVQDQYRMMKSSTNLILNGIANKDGHSYDPPTVSLMADHFFKLSENENQELDNNAVFFQSTPRSITHTYDVEEFKINFSVYVPKNIY